MNFSLRTFLGFSFLFFSFFNILLGQKNNPKAEPKEPVLVPLTEEEKKIDLKSLMNGQPDYSATLNFFFSEGFGGFSASQKVASKGNLYRIDTGVVVIISEPGKPDIRMSGDTFEREIGDSKVFITPSASLNPKDLLSFEDVSFSALGTIDLDGHKCLKIEAKSKSISPKIFLYAALDMKNLILAAQVLAERQGSVQRLINISFDVPDSLFQIPKEYQELPKYNWEKVTTAKVLYKGNLVNSAKVFRHDDYLYVYVEEFESFLVDLKKNVADTAVFQGLLVAKDGRYIWKTNEDKAVSSGDLGIEPNCEFCVKIKSEQNSLTIPYSNKDSRILVKVSW